MITTPGPRLFGAFRFDVESGELAGPSGTVRLQPQPARVLSALLDKAGELVTREELKKIVWSDTHVEADQGLNYCVRQIRLALGENDSDDGLIETLPRRGYRLRVPSASATTVLSAHGAEEQSQRPTWITRPLRRALLAGISLIMVVTAAIVLLPRSHATAYARTVERHVAILPLTTKGENLWALQLNREVTEAIVVVLANDSTANWQIIGPATTSRYADDPRDQMKIGAELNVQYVISGGVRVIDSTLFVQMIRVSDGVHVSAWREKIEARTSVDLARIAAVTLSERLR